MSRIFFVLSVLVVLTSCATHMVFDEIDGGDRLIIKEYVSDVKRAVHSPDGKLNICLEITDMRAKSKRLVTMVVPPDKQRESDINGQGGSRYVKVSLRDDPVSDCDFTGKKLPLIYIKDNHKLNEIARQFDISKNSAIYALEKHYLGSHKYIANVGHFKLMPNESGYEFRQFLYNHELYEKEVVDGNPWMYAVLPLAIAADILLVLVSNGEALKAAPESKSNLWKNKRPNDPIQLDEYNYVDWVNE